MRVFSRMKLSITAIILSGALALAATPALAAPPSNAKAYGKYCQNQSKKKAEGAKKSDFAMCVNAMAKAAKSEETSPKEACSSMSKKHVKGEKGTAYSRCVVAAAKLKRDQGETESAS
jgi:hypothetical protein